MFRDRNVARVLIPPTTYDRNCIQSRVETVKSSAWALRNRVKIATFLEARSNLDKDSLQLRRRAFPGAETVPAFIATGSTFVEQANKLTTFADALQKLSSVVPGNDLRLDIAESSEEQVLAHVKSLCDAIASCVKNDNTISVLGLVRIVDYKLYPLPEAHGQSSRGESVRVHSCTAVYADPAVGKSIASLRALPAGRASKNYTVLVDGGFRDEMQRFFRVTSFDGVGRVARLVFPQLKRAGVSINMVLDNSIEEEFKLEDWQNALRA